MGQYIFFFFANLKLTFRHYYYGKYIFSLHMHAKPSFAHRLQIAKMASSHTSAQNNGPRAQKNGPWV